MTQRVKLPSGPLRDPLHNLHVHPIGQSKSSKPSTSTQHSSRRTPTPFHAAQHRPPNVRAINKQHTYPRIPPDPAHTRHAAPQKRRREGICACVCGRRRGRGAGGGSSRSSSSSEQQHACEVGQQPSRERWGEYRGRLPLSPGHAMPCGNAAGSVVVVVNGGANAFDGRSSVCRNRS